MPSWPSSVTVFSTSIFCRSNDEGAKSVASRKSGSSGSPKVHEPSFTEDDEEDLWSVWGDVIRNWEQEVKKNPVTIKVGVHVIRIYTVISVL